MNTDYDKILVDCRASAVLYRFLSTQRKKQTVLLPVNICSIVSIIVKKAGFDVEYVDISPIDLCADEENILNKLNKGKGKYSGILYNYTYGLEIDKTDFFKLIKANYDNIWIIEDKCSNVPVFESSSFVDLTLYSTGYAKQVDLDCGGFGILHSIIDEKETTTTKFEIEIDKKNYNFSTYSFSGSAKNYFNSIENRIPDILKHKKKLNCIYMENLPNEIQMENCFNNWRFHVLIDKKEEIIKKIFSEGLFVSNHFKPLSMDTERFPNSYKLYDRVINLFNDFYYTEEQAIRTCEIINECI